MSLICNAWRYISISNERDSLMNKALMSLSLLIALSLGACGVDKNGEDYRTNKVNEKLAKLKEIEGTYQGQLVSMDQSTLGTLKLELTTDTNLQNSSDNLGSEQQAIVSGSLTYNGITNAKVIFQRAFYDDSNGQKTFKASIPISISNTEILKMTLAGTINNGIFTGNIYADGFKNDYGGSFTLLKDGPAVETQNISGSGRSKKLRSELQTFSGTYLRKGKEESARLALNYPEDSARNFLNIFLPTRKLIATLDFGNFPVTFTNAKLDEQIHTLEADTTYGTEAVFCSLKCQSVIEDNEIKAWDCHWKTSQNTVGQRILFKPAPQNH